MHAKDAIIFSPNQVVTKIQVTLIRGGTVLFLDQVVVILGRYHLLELYYVLWEEGDNHR